jgi:heme/copper-type cytochrome/quinol oxidase subunit 3
VVRTLGWDKARGTGGMLLFILTEAMLFVCLFFAYFYLGAGKSRWPMDEPPKLALALVMLVLLAISSGVLEWGRRKCRDGNDAAARGAVILAILIGVAFIILQGFEYRDHLRRLLPTTDTYGSIFYTITSFHALHLVLGLLMLGYVAVLPRLGPGDEPPHRPLHDTSFYWHFVDGAWFVIVALLYVLPRFQQWTPS